MAKQSAKPDMPAEMWLHVATDALARYATAGGLVVVAWDDGPGIVIRLPDVAALNDPRLAPSFPLLVPAPAAAEEPTS